MSDPTPTETPRKAPRWMIVLLVLSLGVNLLAAGAVIGAGLTRAKIGDDLRSAAARDLGRTPFVMALEPADRRALARELRREAGGFGADRAALRDRFERLLTALRAESFDRAEVEGLIGEQRRVAVGRQEIGERVLLDRLEEMSPEARRAYADRLDRSLRRSP